LIDINANEIHRLDLSGNTIRVNVGKEERMKKFTVHASVVCRRPKFFEKAMSGDWKEAQDKSVDLREDDPETFSLYTQLLYTGTLPIAASDRPNKPLEWSVLARLYVLAEMLMDITTKNTVLNALLSKYREVLNGMRHAPGIESVKIIYEGTSSHSPARRLMVDCYNDITTGSKFITTSSLELPRDFLYDLTIAMLDHRHAPTTGMRPYSCDATEYHEKK
jgi:hypothetical protein